MYRHGGRWKNFNDYLVKHIVNWYLTSFVLVSAEIFISKVVCLMTVFLFFSLANVNNASNLLISSSSMDLASLNNAAVTSNPATEAVCRAYSSSLLFANTSADRSDSFANSISLGNSKQIYVLLL